MIYFSSPLKLAGRGRPHKEHDYRERERERERGEILSLK
jgi:hypothetical protein